MSYTESNADRSNMRMDFKEGGAGKGQCHEYSQDRTRISPLYLEKNTCSLGKFYTAESFLKI